MDKIWGAVRNAIAVVGGIFIGFGWVSEVDWSGFLTNLDTVVGGITAAVAIALSIVAKFKASGGLGGIFGKKD